MEAIAYTVVFVRAVGCPVRHRYTTGVAVPATGRYAFTTLSCNCRARELLRAREPRTWRETGREALRRARNAIRYIWREYVLRFVFPLANRTLIAPGK